jgi:hypothetical protein
MYTSKQQVSCFYCDWVGRKDKAKEHLKKKQHPEEAFKLKISENNLIKYNFRKELLQRARSIKSDDDEVVTFIFI